MELTQLKIKLNQALQWASGHKKWVILMLASTLILFLVFQMIFGFRLKKLSIEVPDYIYLTGEQVEIDYTQISAGLSLEVIQIIAPSAENDFKSMSINLVTTNIIIEDHQSGVIWETLNVNPALNTNNQNLQKAPLFVTYMYEGWTTGKRLDAFTHSISQQKYTIEIIDGGVRVNYHIGVHTPTLSWMPQRITESLYDQLHQATDTSGKIALQSVYQKPTGANFYQIVTSIAQPFIDRIYRVWYEEYGLTFETLFELNQFYNIRNNFIEVPSFEIPVEYTLNQGDFIARVVLQEIKETSLSFEEGKTLFIQDIDLLPYFQSSLNASDAFMFVPDGSGAIIEIDQPDFNFTRYTKGVYDSRSLLSSHYTNYVDQESILMPVFGYARGQKGVFGIIESGAMQSLIQIRRASSNNNLNAIYPTIVYRHKDVFSLSGINIDMYSDPLNDTDYQVRYQLLQDDFQSIHYMDMVKSYQNYLFGNQMPEDYIPEVHVNVLGAIKDRAFFVGIPYEKMIGLSTYQDAVMMMESLGTHVKSYTYVGWSEGGIQGQSLPAPSVERALGNQRDFKQLNEYAAIQNIHLSYDTSIVQVYTNGHGFQSSQHSVKLIGDYTRTFYPYDLAKMLMQESSEIGQFYLMSPSYLTSAVYALIKRLDTHIQAVELRDLGNTFIADYGKNGYSPVLVENIINQNLSKLSQSYDLTLKKPYMHAVPYATYIADTPYRSSSHFMFSYDIPFYQLVINGHKSYRLESINSYPLKSSQSMFLKALETSSGLTYDITKLNSSITKTSPYFNYIHSTAFDVWSPEIISYSEMLQAYYQAIGTSIIAQHRTLQKGITLITYDNNKQVIINQTNTPFTYLGETVLALDYYLLGG